MNILISQPFGLGDCIFCMTLARKWITQGHSVTWPVFPQFVTQLRRAYPDVTWVDYNEFPKQVFEWKDEKDWEGYRYIPLRWANEILSKDYNKCMSDKYELFDMAYEGWKEYAMWERTAEEFVLQNMILSIPPGLKYNLINRTFGSDCYTKAGFEVSNGLVNIEMEVYPGVSLFDWQTVMEAATEIHTVSTSIIYMLELLDIPGERVHLYPRPGDPHFKQVKYLFTKPYILHEANPAFR